MEDYKCITKTTTKGKKSLSVASQLASVKRLSVTNYRVRVRKKSLGKDLRKKNKSEPQTD